MAKALETLKKELQSPEWDGQSGPPENPNVSFVLRAATAQEALKEIKELEEMSQLEQGYRSSLKDRFKP